MHTARQLDESMFQIEIGGRAASRDELFEEWGPLHRFGVVVHDGFGAVGASYLLQLAITAYFDALPERRDKERPTYPDVFVFHVGGRYGDYAYFDVYPPRKEVFVEDDPAQVLEAINDRGITHLAVPDRSVEVVKHAWKEPAQARDRVVAAWAYSPDGRVADGDVAITSSSRIAEANAKICLHPARSYHEVQEAKTALGAIVITDDEFLITPGGREDEVPAEDRDRIRDARQALDGPDGRTETYRRVGVDDAIGMLRKSD